MVLGKRKAGFQGSLFRELYTLLAMDLEAFSSLNAFYETLDRLLCKEGVDVFVKETCRTFYADSIGGAG